MIITSHAQKPNDYAQISQQRKELKCFNTLEEKWKTEPEFGLILENSAGKGKLERENSNLRDKSAEFPYE